MQSFANLKRTSSDIEKLNEAVDALNQNNFQQDDENFWKPEVDKVGNGFAIIRFLPTPPQDGDDGLPWVKYWDHGFKGPGGWYIERSLTTLSKQDPASEYNSKLWATGIEANRQIARNQKRRLHYVSNIKVIEDPKHPENNGKVFKYTYGTKLFEKISSAMRPEFEDEIPFVPFDFWKGANLKLKIRRVDGFWNYDKSEWENCSALATDDKELEAIWKSEFSLKEIVSPEKFKNYDELKSRLERVLGTDSGFSPTTMEQARNATSRRAVDVPPEEIDSGGDPGDDDLKMFEKLAQDADVPF